MARQAISCRMEELASLARRQSLPVLSLCIQVLGAHPDWCINGSGFAQFPRGGDPDALAHRLRKRQRLTKDLPYAGTVI